MLKPSTIIEAAKDKTIEVVDGKKLAIQLTAIAATTVALHAVAIVVAEKMKKSTT